MVGYRSRRINVVVDLSFEKLKQTSRESNPADVEPIYQAIFINFLSSACALYVCV